MIQITITLPPEQLPGAIELLRALLPNAPTPSQAAAPAAAPAPAPAAPEKRGPGRPRKVASEKAADTPPANVPSQAEMVAIVQRASGSAGIGHAATRAIIASFGADRLTNVPQEKWAALREALQAALDSEVPLE